MYQLDIPAVVMGTPETGLEVARSLGKKGITVYGINFQNSIASSSKFILPKILPHPISNEKDFTQELISFIQTLPNKPALFIASDEYLQFYVKNESIIHELFQHNLPKASLAKNITDKYEQYHLALNAEIPSPKTCFVNNASDLQSAFDFHFPLFVKARDVNSWRKVVSGTKKGFVVENKEELQKATAPLISKSVPLVIQEIIKSDDRQNFKSCVLIDKNGTIIFNFGLSKLHQFPIHFGVGSCVISCNNKAVLELGEKLFTNIHYTGVGSAEFKYDMRDNTYKLIEINPRYWQQNSLADFSGMNFPFYDYLIITNQEFKIENAFNSGLKWVNLWQDYESYRMYKKAGELTFFKWLKDIGGKKKISFYQANDLKPFLVFITRNIKRQIWRKIKPIIKK